jgi:hypothetical protein
MAAWVKKSALKSGKNSDRSTSRTVRAELVEALLLITNPFDRLRANGDE